MALTVTTLAAAVAANDTTIRVTSATGAEVGSVVKVDGEYMFVVAINGTALDVRSRGSFGTKAVAHAILAPVLFAETDDLPDLAPGTSSYADDAADLQSIGASGAIDVSALTRNTTLVVQKATAAALTLAAPSKAQNGLELTILSGTAAAHTVTYTAGFYGDTTSSDVATFAAKAGASMTIVARDGTWGVKALANVTLA